MSNINWTKSETVQVAKPTNVQVNHWVLVKMDLDVLTGMAKLNYYGYVDAQSHANKENPIYEKETMVDLSQVPEIETALTAIVSRKLASL